MKKMLNWFSGQFFFFGLMCLLLSPATRFLIHADGVSRHQQLAARMDYVQKTASGIRPEFKHYMLSMQAPLRDPYYITPGKSLPIILLESGLLLMVLWGICRAIDGDIRRGSFGLI